MADYPVENESPWGDKLRTYIDERDSMIVLNGAAVVLDSTLPNGHLIGYRVVTTSTIGGVSFEPGSYIFERNSLAGGGWTYRTVAAGEPLVVEADTTAPTAPTLAVDNSSDTQLVATFSGGTDAVGVTQYRTRINGGAWTVGASPRTFTGLTPSTSYTIDAQAGDAAGNWSTSATWTGSTAAALPTWSTVATDDFTGTNAAAIVGRTTTTGALTWAATPSADASAVIQTNKAAGNGASAFTGAVVTKAGAHTKIRASASYDVSAASSWAGLSLGTINGGAHSARDVLMRANGECTAYKGSVNQGIIVSGQPLTGTLSVEGDIGGTVVTVKVNGSTVGTTTVVGGDLIESVAGMRFFTTGGRIDDFVLETYA